MTRGAAPVNGLESKPQDRQQRTNQNPGGVAVPLEYRTTLPALRGSLVALAQTPGLRPGLLTAAPPGMGNISLATRTWCSTHRSAQASHSGIHLECPIRDD